MFAVNKEIVSLLTSKLQSRFGDDMLVIEHLVDMPVITVRKSVVKELIRFLYDDDALQFRFLTSLCGIHYPDNDQQIGVVYHLHSLQYNQRIRIKAFSEISDPVFPSVTEIFSAAGWMERETWDFFGVVFKGHPNLKRILNVEEMDYFPMRKEYPLEDGTREDKDDKMFGR